MKRIILGLLLPPLVLATLLTACHMEKSPVPTSQTNPSTTPVITAPQATETTEQATSTVGMPCLSVLKVSLSSSEFQ